MAECEYLKRQVVPANSRNPQGGTRILCNCNGLPCLVDDFSSVSCMRYAWVKRMQNKTVQLVKLQDELNQLALEGMPDHG